MLSGCSVPLMMCLHWFVLVCIQHTTHDKWYPVVKNVSFAPLKNTIVHCVFTFLATTCQHQIPNKPEAIWVTVAFLWSPTSLTSDPLTSTQHVSPHNCLWMDVFFFLSPFSVNSRDGCLYENQKISSLEILSLVHLASTTTFKATSITSPFWFSVRALAICVHSFCMLEWIELPPCD